MAITNLVPGYPVTALAPLAAVFGAGSDGVYNSQVNAVVGAASATVTIAGTPASGNTITVTINGHAVTYTLVGGDTTTALTATHVAAAITADSTDGPLVTATASGSVITITAKALGSAGNLSLSTSATGGGATATASTGTLSFANNYYIAKVTFSWRIHAAASGAKTYYKGQPYQIDPTNAALMRTLGNVY